jgi:hypothetical protein
VDAARMRLLHLIHAATLQFHDTHHRLPDSARFPADAELLLHCVSQLSAAIAWEGDYGEYGAARLVQHGTSAHVSEKPNVSRAFWLIHALAKQARQLQF